MSVQLFSYIIIEEKLFSIEATQKSDEAPSQHSTDTLDSNSSRCFFLIIMNSAHFSIRVQY